MVDAPFDHLEAAKEVCRILAGTHSHWAKRGAPEDCAQRFLHQVGRSHAYAGSFADDLAEHSEEFAAALEVDAGRVVWMAIQLRAGVEHARTVAQARRARRLKQKQQ